MWSSLAAWMDTVVAHDEYQVQEWPWGAAVGVAGLLLLATTAAILWTHHRQRARPAPHQELPLPPGPRWPYSWPVVGIIPSLGPLLHRDLRKLGAAYGPVAAFRLGSVPCVVVSSAEAIHEVVTARDQHFLHKPEPAALREVLEQCKGTGFGRLTEQAVLLRRIVASEIMSRARIRSYEGVRRQDGLAMLESVYRAAGGGGGGTGGGGVVDLRGRVAAFAANSTTQILFGKRFHGDVVVAEEEIQSVRPRMGADGGAEDFRQLLPLVSTLLELFGTVNIADFLPLLRPFDPHGIRARGARASARYNALLGAILADHRAMTHPHHPPTGHTPDFLDVLLSAQRADPRLTDATIKGGLSDVLLGGIDSTQAAVEWAVTLLVRHPRAQAAVHAELDALVGRARVVEEADLPRLPRLRAVVAETLRVVPPFPFSFRVLDPAAPPDARRVGGFRVPPGALVFLQYEAVAKDPARWRDPDVFDPDRFLNGGGGGVEAEVAHEEKESWKEGQEEKEKPAAPPVAPAPVSAAAAGYPFGAGRRGCPGKPMGVTTVTYALALLLQAFVWEAASETDVELEDTPGMTRFKAVPLRPKVTPRLPAHLYTSSSSPPP